MGYYWTTVEDRGSVFTIEDGGYYEELIRKEDGTARLKSGLGGIVPKSSTAEICVSGSPEASLFAKIQNSERTGSYYIYESREEPETRIDGGSLDFAILEEHRYNMEQRDELQFDKFEVVTVPEQAIEDVKRCYEYAEPNSVNSTLAESVKEGLAELVQSGSYDGNAFQSGIQKLYDEYKEAYGEEMAEEMYGDALN